MSATRRTSRLPRAPAAHDSGSRRRTSIGRGAARIFGPILAAALVGSCGGLPPGPTATPPGPITRPAITEPDPSATPASVVTPSPTSSDTPNPGVGPLPTIVIRAPTEDGGATWALVRPGSAVAGSPLQVEPADAELGPAAADGTLLLSGRGRILSAAVAGDRLLATASRPIPGDRAVVPACITGDGLTVLADTETLDLLVLAGHGLEPLANLPGLLGECAPLADGRTLVSTEGGALAAIGPGADAVAVDGGRGRHLSGGGGLVAMIDPSTEGGEVVVRHGLVDGSGLLGSVVARVAGTETERLTDAQLAPDGRWLAVTVLDETGTASGGGGGDRVARLRVYAVTGDGLLEMADEPLVLGARYALLPGGGSPPP